MGRKNMFAVLLLMLLLGIGVQAQTKRSDDFRKKYELKEVVVSTWSIRLSVSCRDVCCFLPISRILFQ